MVTLWKKQLLEGAEVLVVILDLYSRKIVSWKISNTMDTDYGIRISMDSKNRGLDNIFIERVWSTNNHWTMLHQMKSMIRYLKPTKHQKRLSLLEPHALSTLFFL